MSVFEKVRLRVLRVRQDLMDRGLRSIAEMLTTDSVQQAMLYACFMTGAVVEAFTVAPSVDSKMRDCHRWVVEFVHRPDNMIRFVEMLDECMRSLNRCYDAMRDGIISAPKVEQVPRMTFRRWQQNVWRGAVPCVMSDERFIEALLILAREEVDFEKK